MIKVKFQSIPHEKRLLILGSLLIISEIWKQIYLYIILFNGHFDPWYFPFQLCSTPMYLTVLQYFIKDNAASFWRPRIDGFLQDFAMLGGIAALLVPEGFLHPGHPLLSFHGYFWHILLIIISIECERFRKLSYTQSSFNSRNEQLPNSTEENLPAFHEELPIFLLLAGTAELINIVLHPYGDCDMFYISPYHLSSQPVFREIDAALGRPLGIIIYLACIILAAYLIHRVFERCLKP